jgi:uncharacterized membrane protein YeaQ/YmgE (transglycosylase-associated protein family)
MLPLVEEVKMGALLTDSCCIGRPAEARRKDMEIIGVIVAGIIIGLLGKFVAPSSRDNIPLWLTILCGIGGVIIGWYVYILFGGNGSPGIEWVRWLIAIVVAAVLVIIASTLTARMGARRTQA